MDQDKATNPTAEKFKQTAWFLSLAGLIPFIVLAMLVLFLGKANGLTQPSIDAFKVYAACILSFLGGIRWGLALVAKLPAAAVLVYSVLPAIFAWIAVLLPEPYSILVLIICLIAQGLWDKTTLQGEGVGPWFSKLRITITILVILSHLGVLIVLL